MDADNLAVTRWKGCGHIPQVVLNCLQMRDVCFTEECQSEMTIGLGDPAVVARQANLFEGLASRLEKMLGGTVWRNSDK